MSLTKTVSPLKVSLGALVFAAALLVSGCNGSADKAASTAPNEAPSATTGRPVPTGVGNAVDGNVIKIGLVASEGGANRPWGVDSVAGCKLAVDEVNGSGGINGKKVELIVGDSNSDPEVGKNATSKLVSQDKVIAVLGEVASGITEQMANVGFENGVPVVAIGATRTDLTAKGDNIFRVCYTDDFQGPVMAKFAHDELGLRKVAIMTDQKQPYSTGLSKSFRDYFTKLGGEIVDEQFYESGQTQFSGQLTNVKAKNPDGLFLSGYFSETGPIARQAKESGLNVKMMGGDGWDSSEILQTGGEAIIGSFFCNHYNNSETRPEVVTFLAKYKAKNGQFPATTMAALGYDAAMITMDALKRAPEMNSKALIAALEETTDFKGVSGTITLKGNNGNPPKRALVVELQPRDPKNPSDNGQRFRKAYEPSEVQ